MPQFPSIQSQFYIIKMLSKIVTDLLTSRFGKYLSGLDNLTADFWSGQVEVSNVQIRPDLFHQLDLPFAVVSGVVGRLEAKVPWTRLLQESVSVELRDLVVVVRPVGRQDWEYSEESYVAGIARGLERVELRLRNEYRSSLLSGADRATQDSYIHQVTASVLARLQVSVRNIHFRILIPFSGRSAALGLVLRSVSLTSLPDSIKCLSLSGLMLYCDTKKDANYQQKADFDQNLRSLLMIQAEGAIVNIAMVEVTIKTGSQYVIEGEIGEIAAEMGPQQAKVIIEAVKLVFEYRQFVSRE